MAPKPGNRGGIRPTNTLHSSPHILKPNSTSFFSTYANRRTVQKPSTNERLADTGRREVKTQSTATSYGDGFEPGERGVDVTKTAQNPHKRRKLDLFAEEAARPSASIDLTADEDDMTQSVVIGVNGKGLPGSYKASQNGADPSSYFKATEFDHVNAMTSTVPTKRRRKSKDGQGSSQTSSHGTTAEVVNGHVWTNGQPEQMLKHQILDKELEDDKRKATLGSPPPLINLEKGLDETKRPSSKTAKGHAQPFQQLASTMDRMRNQAKTTRGSPRRTQAHQSIRGQPVSRDTKLGFDDHLDEPGSPRLNETFKRDEGPQLPRQKAPQRMKAESQRVGQRVSPIKDWSDSADELAGETTVRSQASRSASPQKKMRSRFGNAPTANGRKRSSSPSDLQPTEFARGTRGSRANIPSFEQDDRYKLRAFYATSCVLTRGDIEMRYDEPEKQFDIYLDGHVQVLRGKQMAVSIGKGEVSSVEYSTGKHSVHLKGPKTHSSNGHICVEFSCWTDVKNFLDQLFIITEEHLRHDPVHADRLEKLFLTQSSEIEKAFKQQNEQREKREIDDLARTKRDAYMETAEEEIKYEPLPGSRNARQSYGSRVSKAPGLFSSPYFENSQPRRSSRQVKPVKEFARSPSPPLIRWTKVNKPQRWAHPVVYPPEGVRRVTVDFQDLERLDEGELLNDNIISFALRRVEEKMAPEHKQEVYFFNSFFYTALTTKNGRSSFNYDAVKRWTKNSDLLGYPYVVVPINNNFHWHVAIICNLPSVSRKIAGGDDENAEGRILDDNGMIDDILTSELADAENKADDPQVNEPGSASRHPDHAPSSRTLTDGIDGQEIQAQTKAMSQLSLSQEDGESKLGGVEGEGDNATADSPAIEILSASIGKPTGAKKSKKRAPPPPKKYDPDQPTIIFLDSMASGHPIETRNLKDYLRAEAEAKRSMDLDTKQLQGMTAKGIPEQDNLSDCGLYLVGFVEQFAKNPRQFVTKVLTRQLDKQADFAGFDPSAKRDEIRAALLKLNEDQDADHKTKKSAKKVNTSAASRAVPSSPTRAPRTSPKPAAAQMPALNQKTDADVVDVPESHVQPTDPVIDPNTSFDTGEEDLEVTVPRPLTRRPRNTATTVQGADTEVPHVTISPQKAAQHRDSSIFNDQHEAGSIAEEQDLEREPTNAFDDEMLDTAEEPNEDATAFRSDAVDPGSKSDLLQGLENEVENKLQEPKDAPGNDVVRTNTFQPSNGKLKPVRHTKAAIRHSEVIDLDSQDAEPEVPESPQEKQPAEPQSRGYGRHTKF
jgi:sentrin-specific protease 7